MQPQGVSDSDKLSEKKKLEQTKNKGGVLSEHPPSNDSSVL